MTSKRNVNSSRSFEFEILKLNQKFSWRKIERKSFEDIADKCTIYRSPGNNFNAYFLLTKKDPIRYIKLYEKIALKQFPC